MDGQHQLTGLGVFLRRLRAGVDPFAGEIGKRIRLVSRIGKRVTQEEISEALEVSREWYSLIENGGAVHVSPGLLERVAALYGLDDRDRATLYYLGAPGISGAVLRRSKHDGALQTIAAVRRFSKRISAASNLMEAAILAAETMEGLVGVDCVSIAAIENSDRTLSGYAVGPRSQFWTPLSNEVALEAHDALKYGGVGVGEYVLTSGEFASLHRPLQFRRLDGVATEYTYACTVDKWQAFNGKLEARSCLAAPLFEDGCFHGILASWWAEPKRVSDLEIDVAETISSIIALAARQSLR